MNPKKVKSIPPVLDKLLNASAKSVAKEMLQHFKKDGWPLCYSHNVGEVFFQAFGIHLETYLVREVVRLNSRLVVGIKKSNRQLVFAKAKDSKLLILAVPLGKSSIIAAKKRRKNGVAKNK